QATIPRPLGARDGGHDDADRATLPEEPTTGVEPELKNVDEAASQGALPADGSSTKAAEGAGTTPLVPKRAREPSDNDGQDSGAAPPDEPPPNATLTRRCGVKPKPNIPLDRRPPATPLSE
ncbi:unnamed protein product, partial [Ixodes hexagonus]